MKILPIAVDDFADFSQQNLFYADKTRILRKLLRRPMPYFLSRPRRFGKTLLVSALEKLLRGHRELFKGLWIYKSDYNWAPHPVIKLEMNALNSSSPEDLKADLIFYLRRISKANNLYISEAPSPQQAFVTLIKLLYAKHNEGITDQALKKEVAVLIDEYDAPIIKQLERGRFALAASIRATLADFYGILKTSADKLGFVFMTGITRLASSSSFSALNNFEDLTLNPSYLNNCRTNPNTCGHDPRVCEKNINHDCDINFSDICGFNLRELKDLLRERQDQTLLGLKANKHLPQDSFYDDALKLIKECYGAYSWDGKTKVFNPWSVISFLKEKLLDNYWHKSGTSTFLPKLVRSGQIIFDLSKELVFRGKIWNSIDVNDKLSSAVLLFQTGYLTIKEILDKSAPTYRLGPPNLEIAASLGPFLLSLKAPKSPLLAQKFCQKAFEALFKLDAEGFQAAFSGFLGQIPFDRQPDPEKYYQSLFFYAIFLADLASYQIAGLRVNGQAIGGHRGPAWPYATLKDPEGNVFIIDIKRLVVEGQKGNSEVSLKMAAKSKDLAQKMASLASQTLTQINKKYIPAFLKDTNRIFNVALVVAGLNTVLARIKEANKENRIFIYF
ncbi:MAG: AAA family ATPase [Deltaproteobacteria bacterium]|jgi:hypothetical protein|nr:AAA family ATPase [Deltaproteobacteria bacterium]